MICPVCGGSCGPDLCVRVSQPEPSMDWTKLDEQVEVERAAIAEYLRKAAEAKKEHRTKEG